MPSKLHVRSNALRQAGMTDDFGTGIPDAVIGHRLFHPRWPALLGNRYIFGRFYSQL